MTTMAMKSWTVVTFLIAVSVVIGVKAEGDNEVQHDGVILEKQIHKDILTNYNVDIKPEGSHNEPLHVHFDNKLQKIVKLDVKHQIFVVNSFVLMRWHDPQLAWNTSKYNGIDKINLDSNLIWTPDIILYNTAHEESFSHHDLYKTKASVFHSGLVIWMAPVTWMVSCIFDVTWFPVDKQVCNLTFGSWSYSHTQIKISPWIKNISLENFRDEHFHVKNGEWEISNLDWFIMDLKFSCCPEPYSTIVYEIHLNRMSLYYFLYIILPLISQVFLFLMIFHIPNDTGERMGFGVTILLSITVYLLVISEKLPEKSDDRPMLGVLFIAEFYILCMALITTVMTHNLSLRKKKPPNILRKLVFWKENLKSNQHNMRKLVKPEKEMLRLDNGDNPESHSMILSSKQESEHRLQQQDLENCYLLEWEIITGILDKVFFYAYLLIVVFVPIVVLAILDRKGLGI